MSLKNSLALTRPGQAGHQTNSVPRNMLKCGNPQLKDTVTRSDEMQSLDRSALGAVRVRNHNGEPPALQVFRDLMFFAVITGVGANPDLLDIIDIEAFLRVGDIPENLGGIQVEEEAHLLSAFLGNL